MEISNYVIYELLIRLQELHPGLGEYFSSKKSASGVLLRTTTGSLELPKELLYKQFREPSLISQMELLSLIQDFMFAMPAQSNRKEVEEREEITISGE